MGRAKKEPATELAARIQKLMQEQELTDSDCIAALGVASGQWYKWANGDNEPGFQQGCEIAEMLGVHPTWLATGEEQNTKPKRKKPAKR